MVQEGIRADQRYKCGGCICFIQFYLPKSALIATLNLKKEWMASVDKREKELGIR